MGIIDAPSVFPKAVAKLRMAQGDRLGAFMYDAFDRSNRTLNGDTAPTGGQWAISGPGYLTTAIENGTVVRGSGGNFYAVPPQNGEPVKRFAGTFSFDSGSGDRFLQKMTLSLDKVTTNNASFLYDMFHLNFGPDKWTLTKRKAGGTFDAMTDTQGRTSSGDWFLAADAVHGVSFEVDKVTNTLIVNLPNGDIRTYVDADVSVIDPRYGWIQIGDNGGEPKCHWHSVTTGASIADALRGDGQGASSADLLLFAGEGLTRRQKVKAQLIGAAGWYRVATYGTIGTFAMAGNVKISFSDSGLTGGIGRAGHWDFDVATDLFDATNPSVTQNFAHIYYAGITQARVSRLDAAPYDIALDIYKTAAEPLNVVIEFFGTFKVQQPTPNAVALVTKSTVLAMDTVNHRIPTVHAATHADGGTDEISIDASQLTSGTIVDARIPATIARDTEVAAGYVALTGAQDVAGLKLFKDGLALGDDALANNMVLRSETNTLVDILQLGTDGSGVLREKHITTADQLGTGAGAILVMNPGASGGLNQAGGYTVIAGGLSTGTGLGGAIFFQTSTSGVSGSALNTFTTKWQIDDWGGLRPNADNAMWLGQTYARVAKGFFVDLQTTSISASAATITGGTITGITDLTVADGGTGASTPAAARTNLIAPTMLSHTAGVYAPTAGRIFIGIEDPVADGYTPTIGDVWIDNG